MITAEMLLALKSQPVHPIPYPFQVIFSEHVLRHTDDRLFPESKHRSARIFKKLVKRHGGVFRKEPAIIRVGNVLYAHPSFRPQLNALADGKSL